MKTKKGEETTTLHVTRRVKREIKLPPQRRGLQRSTQRSYKQASAAPSKTYGLVMAHVQTIRLSQWFNRETVHLQPPEWRHRDRTAMTNTCAQCWKYNPPDACMIFVGGLKQKYTQTETLSLRSRRKLLHTDVYSSLDLSFKLIKLGWTTVTAPSHSRQTNLT